MVHRDSDEIKDEENSAESEGELSPSPQENPSISDIFSNLSDVLAATPMENVEMTPAGTSAYVQQLLPNIQEMVSGMGAPQEVVSAFGNMMNIFNEESVMSIADAVKNSTSLFTTNPTNPVMNSMASILTMPSTDPATPLTVSSEVVSEFVDEVLQTALGEIPGEGEESVDSILDNALQEALSEDGRRSGKNAADAMMNAMGSIFKSPMMSNLFSSIGVNIDTNKLQEGAGPVFQNIMNVFANIQTPSGGNSAETMIEEVEDEGDEEDEKNEGESN